MTSLCAWVVLLQLYKDDRAVWATGTDRSQEKPAILAVQVGFSPTSNAWLASPFGSSGDINCSSVFRALHL